MQLRYKEQEIIGEKNQSDHDGIGNLKDDNIVSEDDISCLDSSHMLQYHSSQSPPPATSRLMPSYLSQ